MLAESLVAATCPACGHHLAARFYSGRQPLATLGWPRTAGEARAMPALPLDFVSCTSCGHVFNSSFDYSKVPYSDMPNLMFNRGGLWSEFLRRIAAEILDRLPPEPVVVEIGHGDGTFLDTLASLCPRGRFIGFDPHGAAAPHACRLELRRELFEPGVHLARLRPDLIVSRHVMEHLSDPLGFIQHLAGAAACVECIPLMYLEVPCVDRALETGRTEDFYYEHNSHFTTASFCRMLDRSGAHLETLGHGYDSEVVYAFVRLDAPTELIRNGLSALRFGARAEGSRERIRAQLAVLHECGKRVAIWGGTGKSAAFLNAHSVDGERFPFVVDSDIAKTGTYVPGTGQLIQFRDQLLKEPVDVIVIPCQWRAADIVEEIQRHGIRYECILIDYQGELVDYFAADHPYGRRSGGGMGDLSRLNAALGRAESFQVSTGPADKAGRG
ncbi:MAG TPA: class I SAM-dependent methyltransferase [Bryobacteraceae bacterium]|nr:class I SAM-dependent methyltransferase [Bryobacteraceae bacterium]